jgi:hypothetical protein
MALLFQAIFSIIALVAIGYIISGRVGVKTEKILKLYVISIGSIVFLGLVVIFWDVYAISKLLAFAAVIVWIYFWNKSQNMVVSFMTVIFTIGAVGAFILGLIAYNNNLKVSEDVLKNSTEIKIVCINDGISVIRSNDKYEYSYLMYNGEVETTTVPRDKTRVFNEENKEKYRIVKIVETRTMINFNVNPPAPCGESVETRYEIYVSPSSIETE